MIQNKPPYFCDTTIVYYRLHGLPVQQREVDRHTQRGLRVSGFIRGEYIRGFVHGLIILFSAIRQENSLENGIKIFNAEQGSNPRRLANALLVVGTHLLGHADSHDVEISLTRLGELIRRTLILFDHHFPYRVTDPLRCSIGELAFPQESYHHDQIMDFFIELENIRSEPECHQCAFRSQQIQMLEERGIDLYSETQQERYKESKGYVSQAKWIDKAVRSPQEAPSCWFCTRMSDSIIALACPQEMALLTGDGQSFPALGALLEKDVEVFPSWKRLRERESGS